MKRFWKNSIFLLVLFFAVVIVNGCSSEEPLRNTVQENRQNTLDMVDDLAQELPSYEGNPYVEVHGGQPSFSEQDMDSESFESYSDLDAKGRCGAAFACVGRDLMPQEKRGSISHIKPSGWQTAKYDFVEGKNLYNRCHLIGFQLTGENANNKNLITGTRYFNVEGMLPFENQVADYVKETGHHVLYRVTPYYEGDNLVASGVQMEGYSIEDKGAGVCFNVYVFNVQPGVVIDYATGESKEKTGTEQKAQVTKQENDSTTSEYVLNTNTKKFHNTNCRNVKSIKPENSQTVSASRNELIEQGYAACKECTP